MQPVIRVVVLTCLLSISFIHCYAQNDISGIVRSSDGEVVPYATITIKDEKILADPKGRYLLSIKSYAVSDTVIFSCIGFQSEKILIRELTRQPEIVLIPIKYRLDEVSISIDKQKNKTEKWGNTGTNFLNKLSSRVNDIYALYIENPTGEPQIVRSVNYFIKEPAGGSHDGPFRVRVYSKDPSTGGPGRDLLNKNLIVKARRKNSWFEVDISKYQIQMPAAGLFVAMEILPEHSYDTGMLKGKKNSYQNDIKLPCLGLNQTISGNHSWIKNEFAKGNKNWRVFDLSDKPANFMMSMLVEH